MYIAYFSYFTPEGEDEHHTLSAAVRAEGVAEGLDQFRSVLRDCYRRLEADNHGLMASGATVYLDTIYELTELGTDPIILDWRTVRYLPRSGREGPAPYFISVTPTKAKVLVQPNPTIGLTTGRKTKRKPFLVCPDLR